MGTLNGQRETQERMRVSRGEPVTEVPGEPTGQAAEGAGAARRGQSLWRGRRCPRGRAAGTGGGAEPGVPPRAGTCANGALLREAGSGDAAGQCDPL